MLLARLPAPLKPVECSPSRLKSRVSRDGSPSNALLPTRCCRSATPRFPSLRSRSPSRVSRDDRHTPARAGTLQGTASYRERIALPPDAVFEAELQDVSRADAAGITLCVDGQRLPVAMEGDSRALETAYREAAPQPGQPVLVILRGLITPPRLTRQ